jgi:large conductance mechanosensitive channel
MKDKKIIDAERIKEELEKEIEGLVGKKEFDDFKKFAFKDKMVDLAIAFMLGAAFKKVVTGISENLVMPCLNFIINQTGSDWRELTHVPVEGIVLETGKFLGVFIDFTIVAIVLYVVYFKFFKKLDKKEKPKVEITTRECPYCYKMIHLKATKCPFCTGDINE